MSYLRMYMVTGLLSVAVFGCSDGGSVAVETPPAAERLKSSLDSIAETGQLGSATEHLAMLISDLKQDDPEMATALESDLEDLRKANGATQIKSKAKSMAEKL